jgi:hypothetical protein
MIERKGIRSFRARAEVTSGAAVEMAGHDCGSSGSPPDPAVMGPAISLWCGCGKHVKAAPLSAGWLQASPVWLAVNGLCPGCYFFQLASAEMFKRQNPKP